ncbi:MAG: YebC/PmpR family DNA-binding transcriptional regulator, partial [Gammaproteobacteria bacterium]
EDRIMTAALEAGAEDIVTNDDGSIEVITAPNAFEQVKQAMTEAQLAPAHAEVTMRASTSAELSGEDAQKMAKLLDMLEDLDDVQNVYSNADLPESAVTA